jgi:hypothetical protein
MNHITDRQLRRLLSELTHTVGEPVVDGRQVAMMVRELLRARKALRFYANPNNWRADDWNVPSVIGGPDYGDPGYTAKRALPVGELRPK